MFWYQTCTPIIFWHCIGIALITAAQPFSRYYPGRGYLNILKYYSGREYFGISKYYSGLGYFSILRYYSGRGYFGISFGTAVGPVLEQRNKWCTGWCTLCQLWWIHWILVSILAVLCYIEVVKNVTFLSAGPANFQHVQWNAERYLPEHRKMKFLQYETGCARGCSEIHKSTVSCLLTDFVGCIISHPVKGKITLFFYLCASQLVVIDTIYSHHLLNTCSLLQLKKVSNPMHVRKQITAFRGSQFCTI